MGAHGIQGCSESLEPACRQASELPVPCEPCIAALEDDQVILDPATYLQNALMGADADSLEAHQPRKLAKSLEARPGPLQNAWTASSSSKAVPVLMNPGVPKAKPSDPLRAPKMTQPDQLDPTGIAANEASSPGRLCRNALQAKPPGAEEGSAVPASPQQLQQPRKDRAGSVPEQATPALESTQDSLQLQTLNPLPTLPELFLQEAAVKALSGGARSDVDIEDALFQINRFNTSPYLPAAKALERLPNPDDEESTCPRGKASMGLPRDADRQNHGADGQDDADQSLATSNGATTQEVLTAPPPLLEPLGTTSSVGSSQPTAQAQAPVASMPMTMNTLVGTQRLDVSPQRTVGSVRLAKPSSVRWSKTDATQASTQAETITSIRVSQLPGQAPQSSKLLSSVKLPVPPFACYAKATASVQISQGQLTSVSIKPAMLSTPAQPSGYGMRV